MSEERLIAIERPHAAVAVIRIDRPKRLNALSNGVIRAIADALDAFDGDEVTRAVVITGDERAFAAGADITEMEGGGPDLEMWDRLMHAGLPLIAAVRGFALGGGLELAMLCDLLVVAEDARLGQPEIQLGLLPGAGGTQRLTRAVGKALAMEMVLLARQISGRDAYHRGLANRCVPAERTLPVAIDLAIAIAAQAPIAVRTAKHAVLDAFERPLHDGLENERAAFRRLLDTDDGREGVAAFTAKRTPRWSGR